MDGSAEACYKHDLVNHVYSGECAIFQKRTPPNENVRFLLRFFLKLRFKDENDSTKGRLSIVDKVPWKKELRSFR